MDFVVLRVTDPNERDCWRRLWAQLPEGRRDVYFLPEYLFASEAVGYGEALCAVARSADAVLLYPFVKRRVDPLGCASAMRDVFDLETPYGYGGPLVNEAGESPVFLSEAWRRFASWCQASGIVTEFVRFHPLLGNHRWAPPELEVEQDRTTVAIDLEHYQKAVWTDPYFRVQRNMVRKAEREGHKFEFAPAAGAMGWFTSIYEETQDRLRARTRFPENYFVALQNGLGEDLWLGVVRKEHEIVVAVLVLQGSTFAHSHLMGYRRNERTGGTTNLVYHGVALEAAVRGLRILHMGGGKTKDQQDALFLFKKSLAPGRATFCIGRRCHDTDIYKQLATRWEARYGPRPAGYLAFYQLGASATTTDVGA